MSVIVAFLETLGAVVLAIGAYAAIDISDLALILGHTRLWWRVASGLMCVASTVLLIAAMGHFA